MRGPAGGSCGRGRGGPQASLDRAAGVRRRYTGGWRFASPGISLRLCAGKLVVGVDLPA
jgi:hypothetical protein